MRASDGFDSAWWRSIIVVVISSWSTVAAHAAAGGGLPTQSGAATFAIILAALGVLTRIAARGPVSLLAVLAAGQGVGHLAMTVGHSADGPPSVHARSHGLQVAVDAAAPEALAASAGANGSASAAAETVAGATGGHGADGPAMLLAHAVTAIVTAVLVAALTRAFARMAARFRILLVRLSRAVAPRERQRRPDDADVIPAWMLALSSHFLRGPPLSV